MYTTCNTDKPQMKVSNRAYPNPITDYTTQLLHGHSKWDMSILH